MMYNLVFPRSYGQEEATVAINSEYPLRKGDVLETTHGRMMIESIIYEVIEIDHPPCVLALVYLTHYGSF